MNKQLKEKISNSFLETLKQELYSKWDWKLNQNNGCFTKKECKIFCGETAEYYNHLVFRPYLSVKNKAISDILNQIFPDSPIYNKVGRSQSKELAQMVGIQWSSAYVNEYDNYHYDIYEDTDIAPIVADHKLYMEQVGFPFFDNFSSLERIDAFINNRILKYKSEDFEKEDVQKELLRFFYGKKETFVGITAAYLVDNPEKQLLIERFRYLHNDNNYVLEDFEKLIAHLEANYS